jgi:hypothetical protein
MTDGVLGDCVFVIARRPALLFLLCVLCASVFPFFFLGDPGRLVVELKAVEKLHPIHEAQLLTYMRLSKTRVGLLINFSVPLLKDGIKRMVL